MNRWALAAGVSVMSLGLLVGCGGSSAGDKAKLEQDNAYEACKHFVNEQLKSPATASYPNFFTNTTDIHLTDKGGGAFEVVSQVDSENGFGAKLRSTFDCNVTTADGGQNWHDAGTTVNDGGTP